jgi:beta-aspartyl-peptidase (threonine type)
MNAPYRAAYAAMLLMLATLPGRLFAAAPPAAGAHDYRDKNFDYFVSGDPSAPRAAEPYFTLALMGGGGSVDAAFAALARGAGHGHLVILRAVGDDSFDPDGGDYGRSFLTTWGPVASAETLVFHNRQASYDPRVLATLAHADGIFLAGGDQAQYIRYWKGTPVQQALNDHVRANRPLGGSSAGLAILGHYSYTALDGGSLESKVALPDPFSSAVTLESDFLHARFLGDVITDSHFSARGRLGRLIVFVARLDGQRGDLKVLGVGIDERSALLIDGRGIGRLADGSAGSAWLVHATGAPQVLRAGAPLSADGVQVTQIGPSSSIDFADGRVSQPVAHASATIRAGVPAADPLLDPRILRTVVPASEP